MSKRSRESFTLQIDKSILIDNTLPCIVNENEFWFDCRKEGLHYMLNEHDYDTRSLSEHMENVLQKFSTEYTCYSPDGSLLKEVSYEDLLWFRDETFLEINCVEHLEDIIVSVVKIPIYKIPK